MASLAAVAEFPALIKNIFLTPYKNKASIYGVKLYIRGKPWVIAVDDYLMFYNSAGLDYIKSKPQYNYPIFA
jgi:hypothetical protein